MDSSDQNPPPPPPPPPPLRQPLPPPLLHPQPPLLLHSQPRLLLLHSQPPLLRHPPPPLPPTLWQPQPPPLRQLFNMMAPRASSAASHHMINPNLPFATMMQPRFSLNSAAGRPISSGWLANFYERNATFGFKIIPNKRGRPKKYVPPSSSAGPSTALPSSSAGPSTAPPSSSGGPITAPPSSSAGPSTAPPSSSGGPSTAPPSSSAGPIKAPPSSSAGPSTAPPSSSGGPSTAPPSSSAGPSTAPPSSSAGPSTAPPSSSGASPPPSEPPIKKRRGRPRGSGKKQLDAVGTGEIGFTGHVIWVNAGEDVVAKIVAFSQRGSPRTFCILSANGAVSRVMLNPHATSVAPIYYEGRFEIVHLSGSYLFEEGGESGANNGLRVSLAGSDCRVLDGGVAEMLIAATRVQVILVSFVTKGKQPSIGGVLNIGGTGLVAAYQEPSNQSSDKDGGSPDDKEPKLAATAEHADV